MSNTKRVSVNERNQAELRHMMEAAAAATVATAAAAAASGANTLASNNIASLIDGGIRHQGLLKKLVKILKINDLMEEYRKILQNVQHTCTCGRTRPFLEEFSAVEAKYKELIIQSLGQNMGGGGRNHHQNGLVGGVENFCYAVLESDLEEECNDNNPCNDSSGSDRSTLAKGSDLNNNKSTGSSTSSNAVVAGTNNGKATVGMSVLSNGISMIGDYDEEDDEEDEDDFEDELDIEEYMALAEVIEKEESRMEKIADEQSEFIYVIRYALTKEIVCYECIVGGSCGFLTRERNRMLLHIAKHFQIPMVIEQPSEVSGHKSNRDSGISSDSMEFSITPVSVGGEKSSGNNKCTSTNGKQHTRAQQPLKPAEPSSIMKPILANVVSLNNAVGTNLINTMHPGVSFVNGTNTTNGNPPVPMVSPFRAMVPIMATNSMGNTIVVPSAASMIVPPMPPPPPQQQQQQQMSPTNAVPVIKTLRTPLDKPIRCPVDSCAFTCDQNYKLRTHNRQVHEKVRPYHCDWPGCFGAYKTRSNLASHRMVHTGEKPFVCNFPSCGAKFARKYDCERHRRIHSEKMYACKWPGCGKKLCDPYNLERHMMVHKGELPYRCPITNCVRGFRELRYLRDHVVNTHKFLPDTAELRLACINTNILDNIKQEDGTLLDPEIARLVAPIFTDVDESDMLGTDIGNTSVASSVDSLANTSTTSAANASLETSDIFTAAAAIAAAAQEQKRKSQQEQKVVKVVVPNTNASNNVNKANEAKTNSKPATTTSPTVVMVNPAINTELIEPLTSQRAKSITTTNAKAENTKKSAEKTLNASSSKTGTTSTTNNTNTTKATTSKNSEPKQSAPVLPVVSKHNLRSRPTPPTATAAAAAAALAAGPPNKKAKRK